MTNNQFQMEIKLQAAIIRAKHKEHDQSWTIKDFNMNLGKIAEKS